MAFDQADGSRFTAIHFYDLGRLGAAPKLTFVVINKVAELPMKRSGSSGASASAADA